MPFGLQSTAPTPQLSGLRPNHIAKSAVQQPQAFANAARAFSPMLKTARQTFTQLPTPMQALGNLSLDGTVDGFERLAMAGGSGSDKKRKRTWNMSEASRLQQKQLKASQRDEVKQLLRDLGGLPTVDPETGKKWRITKLRQMASQQGSSSHRPAKPLDGTVDGFERLAMAGGSGSDKKRKRTWNMSEASRLKQKQLKASQRDEVKQLLRDLGGLPTVDPETGKKWRITKLRQMASQQGSSGHRPAAASSSHRPTAASSSHRPAKPLVTFGYNAALEAFSRHNGLNGL